MKVSIIDWIVKKLKRCIGIVEDGDTASSAITKGQYVVWKGSLYTADGAISSGTTLASSGGSKNLTAVTDGGLNSLNANLSVIGNQVFGSNNSTSKSVSTGTITLVNSVTLTAGSWLVIFSADWSSNSNGYRQISDQNLTDPGRFRCVTTPATTKEMYQQFTEFIVTNGQTVDMYALQNSGSSINVFPYIVAIQIA